MAARSTRATVGRVKVSLFSLLAGPHPRSLSLGGYAPRSGRRRLPRAGASCGAVSKILEPRVLLDERELGRPHRTIALLADDDLCDPLRALIRRAIGIAILLFTIYEHHDVGVLLEGA